MRIVFPLLFVLVLAASCGEADTQGAADGTVERGIQVRYLELVTPKVDETCARLAAAHDVAFSDPVAALGNARTAPLAGGGRLGVRAPMAEHEAPVVRPYLLVEDVSAAVESAETAGATIAHPPLEIPGQGSFAIYVLGEIQHGLWQD